MTNQADPVAADEPRTAAKRAVVNALRDTCEHGKPAGNDQVVIEDFDWYQERLAAVGWTLTEARSLSDSEPSPGLRSAAWNLADSLLVGRDGESVSGQKAAVHWREKVMLQVGSYDPVTGDGYAPDQPQPALPSEPPLTNSGPTLSNTPTGQYHDGVMQTVRAEPERERAGDPLDVERLARALDNVWSAKDRKQPRVAGRVWPDVGEIAAEYARLGAEE